MLALRKRIIDAIRHTARNHGWKGSDDPYKHYQPVCNVALANAQVIVILHLSESKN